MTVSDLSPRERSDDRDVLRGRLSRYDLLLAVIPAAFIGGLLLASVAGVSLHAAITTAAAVGAFALVDGLFLNPPRRPRVGDGTR